MYKGVHFVCHLKVTFANLKRKQGMWMSENAVSTLTIKSSGASEVCVLGKPSPSHLEEALPYLAQQHGE